MTVRHILGATMVALAVIPAPARADTLLVPFWGINFGGDSGQEFSDAFDASQYNGGVSIAFMGGGVFGIEGDIGYSPDFYGKTDIGGSSVFTATGNLLFGVPIGGQKGVGFRPYALAGIGVIRSKVDAFSDVLNFDNSEVAWDFGGGAMFFFGDHFGLRGDIRYFRTFSAVDVLDISRSDRLDFGRASAGLILRF